VTIDRNGPGTRGKAPRILVIRLDYLGDMLCSTALLSAIRQKFPGCYLAVLARSYTRCVLDGNEDIDAVFQYIFSRERERNPRPGLIGSMIDRVKLIRKLRSSSFDYVVVPNGDRHMSAIQFAWQLGAREVLCVDKDSAFDDRNPDHVAHRRMEHEVIAGFRIARKLLGDVDPRDFGLRLHIPVAAKGQLRKLHPRRGNRPSIALSFSARVAERIWGYSNWCELAVRLAEEYQVVVLGSPSLWQDPDFRRDAAASGLQGLAEDGGKAVIFFPTEGFLDLAAAIDDCDLLVSTDGGPVHVGAALKKPVVALFEDRPEKYKRWYPWGVPHEIVVSKTSIEVAGIAVEDVVAAIERVRVA
jgi:ADP-heptose:LPS heptosyltransferase